MLPSTNRALPSPTKCFHNASTKELLGVCPIKSQENANDFFQIRLQQWRTSPAYQQLKSCIMSATTSPVITKIVGSVFGSTALTHVEADYAYRSAFQHALLLTLKELFCEKLSTEIPLAMSKIHCILIVTGYS